MEVPASPLGRPDPQLTALCAREGIALELVARVTAEHRGRYQVAGAAGEEPAVLAGTLRDAIDVGTADRPAVGDWVVLREARAAHDARQIDRVLPRRTMQVRRAAGRALREQVVAANVDLVLIVSGLGRDVNARRIERFAAIAWASGARPVLVLTKADLAADPAPLVERARAAAPGVDVHAVSALSGQGMDALAPLLGAGQTLVLLGTSGAGKSTLVNAWLGAGAALPTAPLGAAGKGRHTTTTRQMIALPSGALVIDTPGVREVGLWTGDAGSDGLAAVFADMDAHAADCRFSDCRHDGEPGCAVARAVEHGTLDPARVDSWQRLRREQERVESESDPQAARRRKQAARTLQRAARARIRDKRR